MHLPIILENIEELRRQEGIDDVQLRQAIRDLHVGDSVRLTFLTDAASFAGETLSVRITSIRGYNFRGKLAAKPAAPGLGKIRVGVPVLFTTAHIHSLLNE